MYRQSKLLLNINNEVSFMTIAGVNFSKISVERKEATDSKITINNNISIKNIEKKELVVGSAKQEGVKFSFEFTSKYEPNFGEIVMLGDVLYIQTAQKIKQIVDGWKKDKNVPKEVMEQIMNAALTKSNIEALVLSQTVNLPPPIQLPKLQIKKD